ncbi:MAG: hypothetical protein HYS17_07105 [Micavibrio aeruginosavorus]|uniref:Uncharacterized protein n=1 Tax=Micavibrio aeruginosavorus TaxID=349221 RepID=A0A7T5R0K7_9BACT|nr:MAG: hypothetical protein HYS17_07105 [Micavibrio aeruginosavorus]
MVDLNAARTAKNELAQALMGKFNGLVNGIGIGKDGQDYCVHVGLLRPPSVQEKSSLPAQHNGVQVKYDVTGPVVAF